ncbi:hypothetical protein GCG21_08635 [Pseudactinotalea sp. HY160]|uniref:hypothetical protein n=1 Tax=Pseudactinotalea sp. HY160 TaxID=2654490 RepID=UPI00128E2B39|nr:hypothetical protein [Pseudactinotalea sp. HY160]MPV50070.1 hypothetical protein [Pseudactinotalea sp. HY160]
MTMDTSNRSRQPAGTPTGGQFAQEELSPAGLSLQPPNSYASSADRPDSQEYAWPAGTPRHLALTAYDDDEGVYVLGDVLEVRSPVSARKDWIDQHMPALVILRRAGVRGKLDVGATDYYGNGSQWSARLGMPAGGSIWFETSMDPTFPDESGGLLMGSINSSGNARLGRDWTAGDLHDALVREVKTVSLGLDARQRVRGLSDKSYQVRPARVQPLPGGRMRLAGLASKSGRDFIIDFDPSSGQVEDPALEAGRGATTTPEGDAWALMARHAGIRGGRNTRAPQRLQEAVTRAITEINDHPNVTWLRDGFTPED